MIHSLAGGELRGADFQDYAKVEILEGDLKGKNLWFLCSFLDLEKGDSVLVELGNIKMGTLGKVVEINQNVSSFASPVPTKKAKWVLRKISSKNKK